ncbi:MAG: hypothetical protein ACK5A0_11105 [Polaromonas sp.]|jgi:hypothetical protein
MNHIKNAIEIVADAPITADDFANCYTQLPREFCLFLLESLTAAKVLRFTDGVYLI